MSKRILKPQNPVIQALRHLKSKRVAGATVVSVRRSPWLSFAEHTAKEAVRRPQDQQDRRTASLAI